MSDHTTTFAQELHDRGLRQKLAKRIAKQVTAARGATGTEPPAKVRAAAEALRRLATEIETKAVASAEGSGGEGSAESAPQAAATQESSRGETSDSSESAAPAPQRARRRARRN